MSHQTHHLYIHVPFCARRCSYCDFSIAVRSVTPVDEYVDALRLELHQNDVADWSLHTLYLGGGTPSRLGASGVARVIGLITDNAHVARDAEVTIEANPDDVSTENANAWRSAGVNRVSLGVQSFDPSVLAWMHRTHSAEQAGRAVQTLRDAGIENVSVDLIFAVPQSLNRNWQADVNEAIALSPSHISLYGLTVEPRTPLGHWRDRGEVIEAPEEQYEADFLFAHDALSAAGLVHYEVSNYGRPALYSRHNSSYWRSVPYAALGPSAHRFDGTSRSWNVPNYTDWIHRLSRGQTIVQDSELLTQENRAAERIYLGLRTNTGLDASDSELETAQNWVSQGWATIQERTIVLTPLGWLRLDALAASLTVAGSR